MKNMLLFYDYYNKPHDLFMHDEKYNLLIKINHFWYSPNVDYTPIINCIKKSTEHAIMYANYVVGGRWKECEPYFTESDAAYNYAKEIIKGPWPEKEELIYQNPYIAYLYVRWVLQERNPEAEKYIKKDPESAFYYAKNVIKGKWPEAEPYITEDKYWGNEYDIMIVTHLIENEVKSL